MFFIGTEDTMKYPHLFLDFTYNFLLFYITTYLVYPSTLNILKFSFGNFLLKNILATLIPLLHNNCQSV